MWSQDEPESASAFLDELGWGDNYDYVIDPGSRAAIALGVFGVPETFFIDRDGIIVGKISGESDALLLGAQSTRSWPVPAPATSTPAPFRVNRANDATFDHPYQL